MGGRWRGCGGSGKHGVSNSIGGSPCVYTGWRPTGRYVTGKVKVNRGEVEGA